MGGGRLTAVSDRRGTYFTFTYPGEVFQVPRFFPVTLGLLKLGHFAHFSVWPLGREGQLSIGHNHVCHLIHSAQFFQGLPRPLFPETTSLVTVFIQEVARSTCPTHLSLPQRRTALMS